MIAVSSNPSISEQSRDLLALTLIPGLGPVRIDRLMSMAGSAERRADDVQEPCSCASRGSDHKRRSQITSRAEARVYEQVDQELDQLTQAAGARRHNPG